MTIQALVERINLNRTEARKFPGCPWPLAVCLRPARTMAEVREFGLKGQVPYPEGYEDKPYSLAWLGDFDSGLQQWLDDARREAADRERMSRLRARALSVMSADDLDFLLGSMIPRA